MSEIRPVSLAKVIGPDIEELIRENLARIAENAGVRCQVSGVREGLDRGLNLIPGT